MNVVASSLHIRTEPERLLAQLGRDLADGRPLEIVRRRCLHIGREHGFVFGNGFMANFLEDYYADEGYGAARALWMLSRTFVSGVSSGPYAARIFRPFVGRVLVDGAELPWRALTGVGAATVREVGLGFKLNHRADEHPDRFSVLAIHSPPLAVVLDAWAVHRGQGVSDKRAFSAVASRLELLPDAPPFRYTIDGDLYEARGPLSIGLGPPLSFVRPR
jgi:diacylglycerol kinase (ATP)